MSRASVLCGVDGYRPPKVVTNHDLAGRLDTTDEWIRSRVGITARHVISSGVSTSDLAVEAGRAALAGSGPAIVDGEVDMLVLATTTPDRHCPATAPLVAKRLGLGTVPAFDVAAVCTGFLYALATATGFISAGTVDSALVIGADTFSTIVDPNDRATATIFGDGAGAVVVRAGYPDELGVLWSFDLGSDGDLADLITIQPGENWLTMHGRAVYRHAIERMTQSARAALDAVGWQASDVDRFVGHQANSRILAAVAAELGIAAERSISNLATTGNTAAASIPLALADGVESGQLRSGDRVLLTAFGGGATWGSTTLMWP